MWSIFDDDLKSDNSARTGSWGAKDRKLRRLVKKNYDKDLEKKLIEKIFSLKNDNPWQLDAICSQTDPEAFFPERGDSPKNAKSICMMCPVRAECLDFAIENDEIGIWGGTSERERRVIRRQRSLEKNACLDEAGSLILEGNV
jgi:WhiB family redox-sensing transcriptional regulator